MELKKIVRAKINSAYQLFRRILSASTIPAIPVLFGGQFSWATWLRNDGWQFAPSKKQSGALRRELAASEVEFYRRLFELMDYSHNENLILDVGANLGYTSLKLAKAWKLLGRGNAAVVCVEPNYRNFPYLAKNLRSLEGWHLIPLAISGRIGFLQGGIPSHNSWRGRSAVKNSGLFSMANRVEMISGTYLTVAAVDGGVLRDFLRDKNVAFCKVDIEGSEETFLENCADWLLDGRTLFQVESNPMFKDSSNEDAILRLAQKKNYQIFVQPGADLKSNHELFLVPIAKAPQVQSAFGFIHIEAQAPSAQNL